MVGHFDDQAPQCSEFVKAQRTFGRSRRLVRVVRTISSAPKSGRWSSTSILPAPTFPRPLPASPAAVEAYRRHYAAYYERCKRPDSPAAARPQPGRRAGARRWMITFATDKATARLSGEFYVNAINVMRGAAAVSELPGLAEQEAFDIEYWLARGGQAPAHAGRQRAWSAGSRWYRRGGGIGAATAARLLGWRLRRAGRPQRRRAGGTASKLSSRLARTWSAPSPCDVTAEEAVAEACARGGVRRARHPRRQCRHRLLGTDRGDHGRAVEPQHGSCQGVLPVPRSLPKRCEPGRRLRSSSSARRTASRPPGAAAYCSAKAAANHLARCLALEGAPDGIRVNVVNPDAVIHGSKIWAGDWRKERAGAYGIDAAELEEHYRHRSMLKRDVLPEDIAEAVYFLASDASAKSTGNMSQCRRGQRPGVHAMRGWSEDRI